MNAPGRQAWRAGLAIAAGVTAIAAAIWLVPASISIVRWTTNGATRVALFAPLSRLLWMEALAVVALAVVLVWARGNPARLEQASSSVGPFALLWIWIVPFLPWLGDRIPLLLVLAGPIRWAFVAIAVATALGASTRLGPLQDLLAARMGRRTVFAVSLAAYLATGAYWARTIGIGGDEPHYLMIAQSLLADGDLLIENNHQNKEYRSFFGSPLRPDFMVRGRDNQIYSIHAPGLSVLLLPAYAIGGFPLSLVMICVIAALMALAVFDLADAVAGRYAALFTWVAMCFTVPIVPAAWLIYPDSVGALIVAWAALWIWKPADTRVSTAFWRGLALATLPWFHTKFSVFLVIFGGALAWRLRRHIRPLAAMALPLAISLAAWLWYFFDIYGIWSPYAPYGDYMLQLHPSNIPRSLLGLLFDQKFGMLVYSPVYLAAIGGAWVMLRGKELRYLGLVLLATTAAFFWGSARMYMWWGGSSAPARFLVPLLPALAPMIAVAVADARFAWARPLFAVCVLASVGVAVMAAILPESRLVYSDPHGYARLLMALQGGSPLASTFPTFTEPDWRTPLIALLPWLAAGVLGLGTVLIVARRIALPYSLRPGLAGALVFLLIAGLGTANPGASLREETVRRDTLDLLWRWDPDHVRAFEYGRLEPLTADRLRELTVVGWNGPAEPVALPPGTYVARVWFAGAAAREGDVIVTSKEDAVFGRFTGALQNPTTIPFELPSDAPSVHVKLVDPKLAERVVNAEIVPQAVLPVSARDGHTVRAVESVTEAPNGYIIYVDSTTFPERGVFWTRGSDLATILVAPGGASRLTLTMFPGPVSGNVRLSIAGHESQVRVSANQIAQFGTDVPSGTRLIPITIQAPGQFRPNEVDPKADDTRRLGVQVRVGLE